ncbi:MULTISPECIES: glycosyltransferase family 2 protein [Kaistia]|uniref:Glycosyltransferase family A protein n=1 Tax=Kaistia nematophila TaxID=2994654 RepID=A0A9X3E1E9_9HYPH|nr:glycosyltransferase family A protein [Kaistia nematophila]MBN9024090.1 glycosyltransferase family 2 protein [Hyphomicrobiales bacterium]MCX5569356.1 glycosyltransferase family A protein [Kaistia nematophila]
MLTRLETSRSGILASPGIARRETALTIGGLATSRLATAGEVKLPKVSFIVRNWNYGRYVGRTIDSIQAQDYPNFEVVIVDNASTDDSREVIERHVGDDPRFRVIHSDINLGPLGGALLGLEHATGDFVAFVDSDDTLLSNFASTHIQVHLASRLNVAFTSSTAIETGPDGAMLNGHRARTQMRREEIATGLRAAEIVPRLPSIDDNAFAVLSRHTRLIQPLSAEWPWSPGTANMYRRFILDMLAPACRAADLPKLSADGHYNRLGHLLGGSAVIDLPLSTYRIHGSNFAASVPSLAFLGSDAGPATRFRVLRMREIMRVFVANAADFSARIGEKRYWAALGVLFEQGGLRSGQDLAEWKRDQFLDEQVRHLAATFGASRTARKLAEFLPKPLLRSSLDALHGSNWPAHARLELHIGAARQWHAQLKRFVRKRRARLSALLSPTGQP